MDRLRFTLGVLVLVSYAPGLLFWFVVHPWARFWRTLGPTRTYVTVFGTLAVLGVWLFQVRGRLLGQDLGTNWVLIAVSVAFYGCFGWLALTRGRGMNHLTFAMRMGVPELSGSEQQQTLLRDGIYAIVRHPIYLSAGLWGCAYALIVNYLGVYIFFAVSLPVLYLVTVVEERELIDRFGQEYVGYRREVPRFIPRLISPRRKTI